MKKNLILISLLLAAGLTFSGCKKSTVIKETTSAPTGAVELKLKWPVGRSMVQNMDVRHTGELNVPHQPNPIKQDLSMGQKYALTVRADRPANAGKELEMEFLEFRMKMTMGGKPMVNYDSSDKPSASDTNIIASTLEKVIGSKLRFLMDPSNRVEVVIGAEEFQKRMEGSGNDPSRAIFKSMFNEDHFKNMLNFAQGLPDKPVQPGDKWTAKNEMSMGEMGEMIIESAYTFENWEQLDGRYCARLSFDGTLKTNPNRAPKTQGVTMNLQNGVTSGHTYFDIDMGMFVKTVMNQDMKMVITVPNPGRNQPPGARNQPMTMTNTMNQAITVLLEDVK